MADIEVSVCTLAGVSENVKVAPSQKLVDFKKMVEEVLPNFPAEQQKLILDAKELEPDTKALEEFGVTDGTMLFLIFGKPEPGTVVADLCEDEDWEGLRRAVKAGYDVNVPCSHGNWSWYFAIHVAACKGNVDFVKFCLESGGDLYAITTTNPKTALQVAAKYGHRDICELLVSKGLCPHEVNTMTSDGSGREIESWSAVQYAKECGHDELGKWLSEQPRVTKP